MSVETSASVRVMSAEEIVARGVGEASAFHWPQRGTVFAERAMRLRQLSRQNAMGDYLAFIADLAQAQQARLNAGLSVPLPDAEAIDRAASRGVPPLAAADWPRDPAWHGVLKAIVDDVRPRAPAGVQPVLDRLAAASADELERQADALLTGVMAGLDIAAAPIVGAALQVLWTHLVCEVVDRHARRGPRMTEAVGRLDDETICPCCGSRPTASIVRATGAAPGQRYLHCSLCGTEWHMARIKCPHCLESKGLAYQAIDTAGGDEDAARRAAKAAVQAETCDACGHYLKIVHAERDPFVDPVADDLATLTLDLLVSETGKLRHGINLMLLFGEGDPPPDPGAA